VSTELNSVTSSGKDNTRTIIQQQQQQYEEQQQQQQQQALTSLVHCIIEKLLS
jgi:uncharacterized protein YbjQ (UPF0145 family)